MFHPEVIAANEAKITAAARAQLPRGLIRRSIDECWYWRDQLANAVDKKGRLTRTLTPQESTVIDHERLICALDYPYWLERYAVVAKEQQDAEPITPLWESQRLFLAHVGQMQLDHHRAGHPDGVLVNVLKARQLGISTQVETIVAHGAVTSPALRCLVAADVQDQAQYLMSMAELVIASLPWYLRPGVRAHQRGDFWEADTGATIRVAWGKSARGGLQDQAKTKGNIGRGKTFGRVHLSEYSTWERPEQIKDGLLPGIPLRPRTFVAFESTAKGRYDAWHSHWNTSAANIGRFRNIFIPWYIEPDKYWLPPPEGWAPLPTTTQHAADVEQTSARFCLGRTYRLSREQLYWYEQTRLSFEEDDALYKFLEEYPATPEEAFQHSGRSIFGPKVLERVKALERPPVGLAYIEPAKDIAQLRAWERDAALRQAAVAATEAEA